MIHFHQGITGIVGPNGCGKSNIVDALFWVMGEQSAKHLRGNTMKDVIFSGSDKYAPGAFAEVTLVLDNPGGKHIHIGNQIVSPTEIQLTRKLYRNGDTEYRINNQICRLKDVQEVFMDTGAGAKSYSIIAQGEINRLVQAKPDERRVMIEEVAGITKFKLRKKESIKKIELTQGNLGRISDLKIEIEKNLKSLEKQSEKATKARELREKIQKNELVVMAHKEHDLLRQFNEDSEKVIKLQTENESLQLEKDQLEISLQSERLSRENFIEKIEILQTQYNNKSKELVGAEEKLKFQKQTLSEKFQSLERREKEVFDLTQEIQERKSKLQFLYDEEVEILANGTSAEDLSDLEELVANLKENLLISTDQMHDVDQEVKSLKEQMQKLSNEIFKKEAKSEELSLGLVAINEEIESLEQRYSGVSSEIASERAKVYELEKAHLDLETNDSALKQKLKIAQQHLEKHTEEAVSGHRSLMELESELMSLQKIQRCAEGIGQGPAQFLQVHGESFQLLGSLISCSSNFVAGIQRLLEDFVSVMIAKDLIESCQRWIDDPLARGLEFLIAMGPIIDTQETKKRLELLPVGEVIEASSVVEFADDQQYLAQLFQGYFLVEKLTSETIAKISTSINFRALADLQGNILLKNMGIGQIIAVGPGVTFKQDLIARTQRINQLLGQVKSQKHIWESHQEAQKQQQGCLENIKLEYDRLREQLLIANGAYQGAKSGLQAKLDTYQINLERIDGLKSKKNYLSKEKLKVLEEEELLTSSLTSLKERFQELDIQQADLASEVETMETDYEEKRSQLLEKQSYAKAYATNLARLQGQIQDLIGQIGKQESRIGTNQELIADYKVTIQTLTQDIELQQQSTFQLVERLQEEEEVLGILKNQLTELLAAMSEREGKIKILTGKYHQNEKKLVELNAKTLHLLNEEFLLVKDIFEKYKIDLRKSLLAYLSLPNENFSSLIDYSGMFVIDTQDGPQLLSGEPYHFSRRYGQDLKEAEIKYREAKTEFARLGEINWQAMEDYERQKVRYNFLRQQEDELRKSIFDLQEAISHIDKKSRERFQVAFLEVNGKFERVFPIIFGGGSARLEIQGSLEDPECGVEIIASPPGKKMQNINLMSGGEKALTAVSLIFSIFLVKPSPFCLLDEVDAPLDDANVGRFNELMREMSEESQFILITHNKKTMELNDTLYGITMQEAGISKAVSIQLS